MLYKAQLIVIDEDGTETTAEASALNQSMLDKAIERLAETAEVEIIKQWTV